MSLYVRMTDTALSGWGPAKGKTNVLVVHCDTLEEAEQIEAVAHRRSEMQRVIICNGYPRPRPNVLLTYRLYSELGAAWKR